MAFSEAAIFFANIYYKRLERGTLQFPSSDQKAVAIDSAQLLRLLEGAELQIPHRRRSHAPLDSAYAPHTAGFDLDERHRLMADAIEPILQQELSVMGRAKPVLPHFW